MILHHFALQVKNLEHSIDFYTNILGFSIKETDTRRDGYIYLDLNDSGVLLELIQMDEGKNINPNQTPCPHVALQTNNLDKVLQILKERGLVDFDGPYIIPNDVKILSLFDPDNYTIDIGQRLK